MLRDQYCQLLTAYVDGVLSKRQHKLVERLLEKSSEARDLLRQLEEDAVRIKNLPPQTLGADFSGQILKKIGELACPSPIARGIPTWLGVAAAAAILLMVTTVSYLFFAAKTAKNEPIAGNIPIIKQVEKGLRVAFNDLDQDKTQARLAEELSKESAVHLELGVKNSARAVERLSQVLQKNHVQVLVDAGTRAHLKKARAATEIIVFAENLRPEELAAILKQIGAQEKEGERQFDTVLVNAMTAKHRQHVSSLLGVDAKQLQPAPMETELPTFIEKAHSQNKKGTPKAIPAAERFAMVMTASLEPGQDPASSPEVQRFLRGRLRQGPRPGTLQVVLVVRPINA